MRWRKPGPASSATARPARAPRPHLTMEYLFKVLAKVDVVHVPFKGGGDMNTAALSRGGAVRLRGGADGVRAGAVGRCARARRHQQQAGRGACRMCRPSPKPASRTSRTTPGSASSRRPRRPARSSQRLNKDINDVLAIAGREAAAVEDRLRDRRRLAGRFRHSMSAAEVGKWAKVVKSIGTPPIVGASNGGAAASHIGPPRKNGSHRRYLAPDLAAVVVRPLARMWSLRHEPRPRAGYRAALCRHPGRGGRGRVGRAPGRGRCCSTRGHVLGWGGLALALLGIDHVDEARPGAAAVRAVRHRSV